MQSDARNHDDTNVVHGIDLASSSFGYFVNADPYSVRSSRNNCIPQYFLRITGRRFMYMASTQPLSPATRSRMYALVLNRCIPSSFQKPWPYCPDVCLLYVFESLFHRRYHCLILCTPSAAPPAGSSPAPVQAEDLFHKCQVL